MISSSNIRGIAAMVLAMGAFIASDSASKFALANVPMFELMMIRGYIGMVLCLIIVVLMDQGRHLASAFNPWVLARGVSEVFANFGFTLAILHMPIADVTAIAQTAPLMVLLGARVIFGDRLGISRLFLIALGLSGALLVAQPGATAASPYALLGFVVAIGATSRDLITRKVKNNVPAPVAALAVLTCLTLVSAVCTFSFETLVIPNARDTGLMFTSGALMVAGHVGVFLAYKMGEARAVAPFMYSLTVWAVLSSVVLFGDRPNLLAIAGMVVILLAGLLVIYVDGRRTSRR
ncbi:MAG: DMT family transporter [Aestuariivirga sp.]